MSSLAPGVKSSLLTVCTVSDTAVFVLGLLTGAVAAWGTGVGPSAFLLGGIPPQITICVLEAALTSDLLVFPNAKSNNADS